ncbi:hypothetical protein [Parasporobacterium paucivorans]|uniref:Uncharacterized protein n=1 Tax=Parasporobacterium paucivorans DSM 15970 TaxID=1122934 RepID=A0A1M6FP04_9FIRM|nr:hypothetical protein [Parasporobacterium paucivorans]SHI99410.1 hypothetical protein SAMN02745691_01159 [Parasporobacterium paucivorans DSM 15970]
MSQEKVDHHKTEKINRKKILKRQKRIKLLKRVIFTIIVLAIIAFLVWSVYDYLA